MIPVSQFDVFRSPSRNASRPFVIILQSNDFARMPTRVVAPLVRPDAMPRLGSEHARVAPRLMVQGREYILNPFDLATLSVQRLGEPVGSFANDNDTKRKIQDALDLVLKPF